MDTEAMFAHTSHRPWPVPARPWPWQQAWCELLFAHWPIPAKLLRPLVPQELHLQEFGGTSWIGVVPFQITDATHRGAPTLPVLSAFPELNLRLYVEYDGKPGVWFLSLDAASRLAVWAARLLFLLPYYHAQMTVTKKGEWVVYRSVRSRGDAVFEGRYRPIGSPSVAAEGTLAHWLTERYCLYTAKRGRLYRAEIHHGPWSLQEAEAEIEVNTIAAPFALELDQIRPLLHFSKRQEVVIWNLESV